MAVLRSERDAQVAAVAREEAKNRELAKANHG
jgi:hypothetical protein